MDKQIIQQPGRLYSIAERRMIVNEYLSGKVSKREVWKKYTGETQEHGHLLRWIRKFGLEDPNYKKRITFASEYIPMPVKTDSKTPKENTSEIDFEKLQLEKRIGELEKQLKDAELKAIAFSTMVDIAEKEFKIDKIYLSHWKWYARSISDQDWGLQSRA